MALAIRSASAKKLHLKSDNHGKNGEEVNTLACAVHEVKLAAVVIHNLWDDGIAPQPVYGQGKLFGKAEVGITEGGVRFISCNLLYGLLLRLLTCQYIRDG